MLFLELVLGKSCRTHSKVFGFRGSYIPRGNYRELPNVSELDFVMMNVGVGYCHSSACAPDCFVFFNGYNIC